MSDILERVKHAGAVASANADNEEYCVNLTIRDTREILEEFSRLETVARDERLLHTRLVQDVDTLTAENAKLKADIQEMVDKAAREHLPAYREQSDRIRTLEDANAELRLLLSRMLRRSRPYIKQANETAEARHDNPDGDYYMDGAQYEIMQETEALQRAIDDLVGGGG